MSAFADALSALATAARVDDLPEPISVSWGWAGDGKRLTVHVHRQHIDAWRTSTITLDGNGSREAWGTGDNFRWAADGVVTGTDVSVTLAAVLRMTSSQAKVRQCLGAAGNPISAEETLAWFDAWPTLDRDQQLAEHADVVRKGAPANLLPKVVCEFCPEMVEPAGQEAICGDCAARKVRA